MTMVDKSTCGTVITFASRSQILRKTSIFAGIASVFIALNLQPANLLTSYSFSAAPSSPSLSFPLTEWKRLTNYFRRFERLLKMWITAFIKAVCTLPFCKISILQVVICCRIVDIVKLRTIFFVTSLITNRVSNETDTRLEFGKKEISLFAFINRPSQSIVSFDKICACLQKMI